MHPFLDVSKLTDEEIISRLGKAHIYLNEQISLGHTPTVQSIKEVIQSLEDERENRMRKTMNEEFKRKFPKDNEPIEIGGIDDLGTEK